MPREICLKAAEKLGRTNKDGNVRPGLGRGGMRMDLNTVKHKAKARHGLENGIITVTGIKIPQPGTHDFNTR